MSIWNRYFFAGFPQVRATLAARGFLLLLAVDIWVNMLESGGRYGVAGFNVAHLELLDVLLPTPTPAIYIGTMTLASFAAFVGAVVGPRRWLTAITLTAFTYGWAMSQLDSYQHHYLMSLVLVCLLGVSRRGEASEESEETPTTNWGGPLLCATFGIVYTFTAISKMDETWRSGVALQKLVGTKAEALLNAWQNFGASADSFWWMMGHATVAVQLVIAAAYFVLPVREKLWKVATALLSAGFVAAIAFHLGTEWIELSIEWFSYYMVVFAVVLLGPRKPLKAVVGVADNLGDRLTETLRAWASADMTMALSIIAAVLVVVATVSVDLPGVAVAGGITAISVLGGVALIVRKPSYHPTWIVGVLAATVAALGMLSAVAYFDTRFDYYRFTGGDAYRRAAQQADPSKKREMLESSVMSYKKANRYAPPDQDRVEKMKRVERELRQLGGDLE
ncbi:MAG: HTTM domain-containing protein [Myxococcota bacterium]